MCGCHFVLLFVAAYAFKNTKNQQFCPNSGFWEFVPVHVAQSSDSILSANWETNCFQENAVSLKIDESAKTAKITFHFGKVSSYLCIDSYIISSRENFETHLQLTASLYPKTITIDLKTQRDLEYVIRSGVSVFWLPCGPFGTIKSLYKTASLFVSADETRKKLNIQFLEERMGSKFAPFKKEQVIEPKYLRSGDQIQILRLDGLDPMIVFGTGGTTGHNAIILEDLLDGKFYVLEGTDKSPFGEDLWPPPYGIIRTEYKIWIEQAKRAGMNAVILPLSDELSSHFNKTAAWDFFESVEGLPYGYPNFLYSFIDTSRPFKNLPIPFDKYTIQLFMNQYDKLFAWLSGVVSEIHFDKVMSKLKEYSVTTMVLEGANHRLGTNCTHMSCLNEELDRRGKDEFLVDIMAIPEQDQWEYTFESGQVGKSMVCSVFCAELWKAGLGKHFPDINGAEQTPKDNYQMKMRSPNRFNEQNCPIGLKTVNGASYCQIIGDIQLDLDGYNSIDLYDHMNDHCPSQWPNYVRCSPNDPKGNQCC